MTNLINTARLLFGALLLYSSMLYSKDVSNTTFLFCLKPEVSPLSIEKIDNSYQLDDQALEQILHSIGVSYVEEWIPGATDRDRHGDIYLNRIYRVFIDSKNDIRLAMSLLKNYSSILYVEHENLHRPHYTPNDPSYDQQCSMSSVKADKAWDIWDIPAGLVPEGQEVLLASVDTGVDYTHPDLKGSLWVNQAELPEWAIEAGID